MHGSTISRSYWLDLFTGTTWQEFLAAGAQVSGFRDRRWKTVQKIKLGDYLLCYLTGISRWIGALEVVSEPYRDKTPIWKDEVFPCRVGVKPVITLTPETAVPIKELQGRLTYMKAGASAAWTGHFRGSPVREKTEDAVVVLQALEEAQKNPIDRPFDPAKFAYRPKTFRAKKGRVTVPGPETRPAPMEAGREASPHDEIQWLLLKLGSDMGFQVWVASNDRGKSYAGQPFISLAGFLHELPRQFDEATNRTISLIDVLWVRGKSFVAAFEIEHSTAIYSGLLRMADLISMHPDLKIPLYIVAPDDRRAKVFEEINRPTFSQLNPPLNKVCRFVPYSRLKEKLQQIGSLVRHLRAEFLTEISEPCAPERE